MIPLIRFELRRTLPRHRVRHQMPLMHDQHPVCHRNDLLQPLLRQKHSRSPIAVQPPQRIQKSSGADRIKLRRRLIKQKHIRLHDHHRGKI